MKYRSETEEIISEIKKIHQEGRFPFSTAELLFSMDFSEREVFIVNNYPLSTITLKSICEKLGLSRSVVERITYKALRRLRHPSRRPVLVGSELELRLKKKGWL